MRKAQSSLRQTSAFFARPPRLKNRYLVTEKQNILILESDRAFALRLAKALKEITPTKVVLTPTVREACLYLVQQRQDLAFIPAGPDDQTVRALRAVQPDLRLVLITPDPDFAPSAHYSGQVQGVLIQSLLDVDLPDVLKQVSAQPFYSEETESQAQTGQKNGAPDTAVLIAALQQAPLGQLLQTVIFADGNRVLAHWGGLNDSEVANVALHVGQEWLQEHYQTRIQFLNLPPRTGDLLLYATCLNGRYLLTLVALPEMPLTQLRRQAQQLRGYLLEAFSGVATFGLATAVGDEPEANHNSYVIVWRSLTPLAQVLHIPLRRALERLALANGCQLRHADVQSDLVHLVVTCPPGRDSDWAAYLFKNGAEEIIQQEYDVSASLWETGYYAAESAAPLTEAELNLFLERDKNGQ